MDKLTRLERVRNCVSALAGKPDFPTFSAHVQTILRAVDEDAVSVRELTGLIVRDYSLTLSLLRRANARNSSGKPILNIGHAVVMLGTEAVRHLAAALLIFEHFHNKPAGVRELMMLSMLSANHVREFAERLPGVHPEEGYICGMVRNIGEILTAYYFPAEYGRILGLVDKRKRTLSEACREVLQFSFEDLGEAVVRYWGMPNRLAECQHARFPMGSMRKPADLLMAAVSLGHSITTAVYRMDPEAAAAQLKLALQDHYPLLRLTQEEVERVLAKAITGTGQSFESMGVSIDELRLKAHTRSVLEAIARMPDLAEIEPARTSDAAAGQLLERTASDIAALLDSGPQLDLNTIIGKIVQALQRGSGFERVVFALANADRTRIEARTGAGDDVDRLIERFRFQMSPRGGPVAAALLRRRRIVPAPANPEYAQISRALGCSAFCLYPIVVADQLVACLYMESRETTPPLGERELRLFEKLRGSLVVAIERSRRRAVSVRA